MMKNIQVTITITIEKRDSKWIAVENTIRNNINDQNVINKVVFGKSEECLYFHIITFLTKISYLNTFFPSRQFFWIPCTRGVCPYLY